MSDNVKKKQKESAPGEWCSGDVILGVYEVRKLVGHGGMGNVYLVYHRGWDLELAVKCPNKDILKSEKGARFFERECETWINLGQHPNVTACYYVRRIDGIPRVFAEYVGGGTMSAWIHNRNMYLDEHVLERMLDVAIQFAWGLRYAHAQGLVHQDVKPLNVLMTPDGIAKVTDFGLARAVVMATAESADARKQLRGIGSRGTPVYCSPEQSRREKLTPTSDIWSWGVSMLEMFVGDVTWMAGPSALQALENYLELGAEDSRIPEMPAGLVTLLRQCFHDDPASRPASMQVVIETLLDIYRDAIGTDYPRPAPEAEGTSADRLNNRAVSMLDLGKTAEARQTWERALRLEPLHLESNYNHSVVMWREGLSTDRTVLHTLKRLRRLRADSWTPVYMMAQAHMERGDFEGALKCLYKLEGRAVDGHDVDSAIEIAARRAQHTRKCVLEIEPGLGPIRSLAFSGGGQTALAGFASGDLAVIDLSSGDYRPFAKASSEIISVEFTADVKHAVVGRADGRVNIRSLDDGKKAHTFTNHTGAVTGVKLTDDGRGVLAAYASGGARLWDLMSGECRHVYPAHSGDVTSICLGHHGSTFLTAGHDGSLCHWEIGTGRQLATLDGFKAPILSMAASQDRRFVIAGTEDGLLELVDLKTFKRIGHRKAHSEAITSVCITKRGHYVLSCGSAGKLRVWDMAGNRCLYTFEAQSPACLSADDTMALAATPDNKVRVFYAGLHASGLLAPMLLSRAHS